jgi:hypothetical protein
VGVFESRNPGISSHVLVLAESLGPIATGNDFVAALQRLYKLTIEPRYRDDLRGIVRWELERWGNVQPRPAPDCVVLPVAGDSTRFFVAGEGQQSVWPLERDDTELPVVLLAREEVASHLSVIGANWVWIVVPQDATAEAREALSDLFHALTAPGPGATESPLVTLWPWRAGAAQLEDAASVRSFLRMDGSVQPKRMALTLP